VVDSEYGTSIVLKQDDECGGLPYFAVFVRQLCRAIPSGHFTASEQMAVFFVAK
jgi:hypothetical protein